MRSLDEFRVLIAPGLHGSGEAHWQTRWQGLYPAFECIEQRDCSDPQLERWSARVGASLRHSVKPAVIVAHSFGCLAAAHQMLSGGARPVAALLVAPADPEKFGVSALLNKGELPVPTLLVASSNDPWMSAERAEGWAERWGCDFLNAGALGHINAESGLGDWLFGLAMLQRLLRRVPCAGTRRSKPEKAAGPCAFRCES